MKKVWECVPAPQHLWGGSGLRWQLSWVAVILGGSGPGGNCPRWQLSGGSYPGGSCPGGCSVFEKHNFIETLIYPAFLIKLYKNAN